MKSTFDPQTPKIDVLAETASKFSPLQLPVRTVFMDGTHSDGATKIRILLSGAWFAADYTRVFAYTLRIGPRSPPARHSSSLLVGWSSHYPTKTPSSDLFGRGCHIGFSCRAPKLDTTALAHPVDRLP